MTVLQLCRVIFLSLMVLEGKDHCVLWGLGMQDILVSYSWNQTGCWHCPCYGPGLNSAANTTVRCALLGNHLTPSGREMRNTLPSLQCGQVQHHELQLRSSSALIL